MQIPVWLLSSFPKDLRHSRNHEAGRKRLGIAVQNHTVVKEFLSRSLSACRYDLQAVLKDRSLNGRVWAWALLEIDANEVDSLLQERTLQRRILLELHDYQALLHFRIKQVVCLQTHEPALHIGDLQAPKSPVFALHPLFASELLTRQTCSGETLRDALRALDPAFADRVTNTAFQLWAPISILAASGMWHDVSLPASHVWSYRCSALEEEQTKVAIRDAKAQRRENVPIRPEPEGQEVIGPRGFQDLGAQICAWASVLLDNQAFDADAERFRMELAVQTCEAQARILENIGAGNILERMPNSGAKRFNVVFLLQALWFAFDLKNDYCLRHALLQSCKLLFPQSAHSFLEQCLSENLLPLPSHSVLSQASFYLDMALMLRMREKHHEHFASLKNVGALYLMADSSPQGHTNWLMLQYFRIGQHDLLPCANAARELTNAALRIQRCQETQMAITEDDLEMERCQSLVLTTGIQKHPMVPVGLGSARADIWHELRAMYHAMYLETGSASLLAAMAQSVTAVVSDRGTEAGIPQTHPVPFNMFFPHLSSGVSFEMDGADLLAMPVQERPDAPHPNLDDLGEAGQVPGEDRHAVEQEPRLSMQQSLPIPGCLHIVHNATRNMLHAMPNFEGKAKKPFAAVVDVLRSSYTRQRFVATCLDGEGRVYANMFVTFPHTVVKWRFGTLAAVCKDLLPLEQVLRRFWDLDKIRFHAPDRPVRQEPDAGPAFGDDHLRGPNLEVASEAIGSHAFWAWLRMVNELAEIVSHVENWFQSCPCHNTLDSQQRMQKLHGRSCPLRGLRAPELAAGAFEPFLQEIAALSAAAVTLMHTRHCQVPDRAWILADFEAAQQHLLFAFIMQTACWDHLPHKLCGIGHSDPDVARAQAAVCLRLWAGFSEEQQAAAHPATKKVLLRGNELERQLRLFVQGVALEDLQLLAEFAARVRFIPLCEKSIEGRHAFTHKVLKKASNAGPVFISMAERMPLLIEWSKNDPELFNFLAQAAEQVFHPLKAVVSLGFASHPDLMNLLANVQMPRWNGLCSVWGSTQKHARTRKKVVYHLDIASQFTDLTAAADFDDGDDQKKNPNKSKPRGNSSQDQFTFEERAAFQKLLDTHETGQLYSVSGVDLRVQSLTSRVRELPSDNLHDTDSFFFDMLPDAGAGVDDAVRGPAAESVDSPQCPPDLTVFRIVALRPSRMKLPAMDKRPELAWTDVAVTVLPILEAAGVDAEGMDKSLWVSASPRDPTSSSVQVLSRGGFQSVQVWKVADGLQCTWDAGLQAALPEDLTCQALQSTAEALVQANAFPGSSSGLHVEGVMGEVERGWHHLRGLGWAQQMDTGLWQVTREGLRSLRMCMHLTEPMPLVNLESDMPIANRSESA